MIYATRATIVCPVDMMADGNQLALAIGESASDDQTFTGAGWQDAAGNLYAVSSTVVTGTFAGKDLPGRCCLSSVASKRCRRNTALRINRLIWF